MPPTVSALKWAWTHALICAAARPLQARGGHRGEFFRERQGLRPGAAGAAVVGDGDAR
jgi:hypothetical protein